MYRLADRPILNRHFDLLVAVQEAYKRRLESIEIRETCERLAMQHLLEFPSLVTALYRLGDGTLPHVPTFQYLATLLSEDGRFDESIKICELALTYDLHDNTVGGFEGRIERIRRKQKEADVSR